MMTASTQRIIRLLQSGFLGFLLVTAVFGVSSPAEAQSPTDPSEPDAFTWQIFNVDADIPDGSRIDYLRIYYYDASSDASWAWVTSYDGEGGYTDITSVTSLGETGYGTNLSDYSGAVVDLVNNAYVLNWRPQDGSSYMQLCGLRVAYRLPLPGGGFSASFSYLNVTGSTLRPRGNDVEWSRDGSGGCLFVPDPALVFKDGFEIGSTTNWSSTVY